MTRNGSYKDSILSKIKAKLHRLILKKRKRDVFLDNLVKRLFVKEFQDKVEKALFAYMNSLKNNTVEQAVTEITKLSNYDAMRVRTIIEQEFGSFEDFIDQADIKVFLQVGYEIGGNHVMEKLNLNPDFTLVNPEVLQRLSDRANFLIKSVDETTKEELSKLIVKGTEAGKSWQEIATDIRLEFSNIARYRSELIARMETANAVNLSEIDFYQKNGFEVKVWVIAGSHSREDECDDNADVGAIGVTDVFPSGDDAPPAHVNCMCALNTFIPDNFIESGQMWTGQ